MIKKLFSLHYSLEALATLLAIAAGLGVLQSFFLGRHFVIPTMFLLLVFLFANLARFGLGGQRWAKHLLFWIFTLLVCHAAFALVWAGDARPGQFLGQWFYPVYGGFALIVGLLCASYAKRNRLFRS